MEYIYYLITWNRPHSVNGSFLCQPLYYHPTVDFARNFSHQDVSHVIFEKGANKESPRRLKSRWDNVGGDFLV